VPQLVPYLFQQIDSLIELVGFGLQSSPQIAVGGSGIKQRPGFGQRETCVLGGAYEGEAVEHVAGIAPPQPVASARADETALFVVVQRGG